MMRRVRVAVAIGLLALVAGGGVTLAAVLPHERPGCWPTLVPAYVGPAEITALARRDQRPKLLIVNPDSGPGATMDPAFRAAVRRARQAGTTVLGYVSTAYGARPADVVLADAERYRRWYGVDGVFLDETSHHARDLPLYRALTTALRAAGAGPLVVNPGVVPARGYFALADVVVTFEGPFDQYRAALGRAPGWLRDRPSRSIAHLVYAATPADAATVAALHPHAGYVYVTAGVLPDPWGSTPGYPPAAGAPGDAGCG